MSLDLDTEAPLFASHGRANNGAFRHRNYAVIYLHILVFACALLLHACASFMQRERAFCKFLCSGGLRSPVAELMGSTASHGMHADARECVCRAQQMHIAASIPSMGTHGYLHEFKLLT